MENAHQKLLSHKEHVKCFVSDDNAKFKPVPPGSYVLLGQEADTYAGGFNENEAFSGGLAQVGLWNRTLTAQEIYNLAICDPQAEETLYKVCVILYLLYPSLAKLGSIEGLDS